MDPKSDPKIDVWAADGLIFEVLGWLLRSRIFDEFSIGKKSAKNPTFGVRGADFGRVAGRNGSGRRIGRGRSEGQESAEIRVKVRHALAPRSARRGRRI